MADDIYEQHAHCANTTGRTLLSKSLMLSRSEVEFAVDVSNLGVEDSKAVRHNSASPRDMLRSRGQRNTLRVQDASHHLLYQHLQYATIQMVISCINEAPSHPRKPLSKMLHHASTVASRARLILVTPECADILLRVITYDIACQA